MSRSSKRRMKALYIVAPLGYHNLAFVTGHERETEGPKNQATENEIGPARSRSIQSCRD